MAKHKCSICGKPGHNAPGCPEARSAQRKVAARMKPPRRTSAGAPAGRRAAPTPLAAPPAIDEPPAVADQLRLRADWLRAQLERIEPWKHELELLEKLIEDLSSLQQGAA